MAIDVPRRQRLSIELASLVDRQADVSALVKLVTAGAGLVTITGAGRVGKTRVALRVLEVCESQFQRATDVVELSETTTGDTLFEHLAYALWSPRSDEAAVLLLDGCEHLRSECAAFVTTMLRRAAGKLMILTTSRQPLSVPGERRWHLGPLDLPSDAAPFEEIAASPAVQL
ncbi:MAG: hypothetical protein JOZ65_19820, partial [Chloroflexi bacterium]|nr:hypothetical protein [Chloroflexota bacterium]